MRAVSLMFGRSTDVMDVLDGPLRPIAERAGVAAAQARLAEAQARLTAAQHELGAAALAVQAVEREAAEQWAAGQDPSAALAAAHTRRAGAERMARVAKQGAETAREQERAVLEAARAAFREELAQRERALVAALDAQLLAAGRITVQLVALLEAARAAFGSGHLAGVWSKVYPPLSPSGYAAAPPGSVLAWRQVLRRHGVLPAGDDQDWTTLYAPLRPAPLVVPRVTPPAPPPELAGRLLRIDGDGDIVRGAQP